MPTAPSSTDPTPMATTATATTRPGRIRAARRAVEDVGILFRFRAQAVRRRHLSRGLAATFVLVTLAVATVPAFMPGANGPGKAFDVFLLLPSAMAGILALNIASAVASGGGRELLSRDQASPYPISPDDRPPRRPAAGAVQHRLDDPGLGPVRLDGLQLRRQQALPGPGGDAAVAGLLHHARPGGRVDHGGRTPRSLRHRDHPRSPDLPGPGLPAWSS